MQLLEVFKACRRFIAERLPLFFGAYSWGAPQPAYARSRDRRARGARVT